MKDIIKTHLAGFVTTNYHLEVKASNIANYKGAVYHMVNRITGVSEHESSYFCEALGYLLMLQEKYESSTEMFEKAMAGEAVVIPNFEDVDPTKH